MSTFGRAPLDRRSLLGWGGGAALLTASVNGCGFLSTDPESRSGPDSDAGNGDAGGAKESPMLTELVEAGELPPLDQRLPKEPLVVEVAEPGQYGGTWHSVTLGPGDDPAFLRIAAYQPPLRKDPMLENVVPNVCTEIAVSDDGKEFTLQLREGVRWSDGEPFTADDIMFAVQDVFANTELHATPPSYLSHDGELAKAEKIDDLQVKITFPEPNGLFYELSSRDLALTMYPKHYASTFLPKYNDTVKQEAADRDYESWVDYFHDHVTGDSPRTNPKLPVLNAWVIKEALGEGNRVVMERNPYFWKTDDQGRQLPYIDTLSWEVVADPQVMVLKGTDGELDLIYRHVNAPSNKPVFARSREDGGYHLIDIKPTVMNSMCVALNLANKDKIKRKLYQNKDFRIGLSHAINREELITAVWQRQGEPWQCAPTADSRFYDEEFAKQYTEYDVDLANAHLDKAGLTERNRQGFRLMPNGKPVVVTLDIATALFAEWPAAGDMIATMWEEVGVRLKLNTIDRTLFYERKDWEANQHDAGVWSGDGGLAIEMEEPRWYMPWSNEGSIWCSPWAAWFSSRGTQGTEPIPAAKQQCELYWKLRQTPEQADREDLFRQILDIAKEQFWVIGIVSSSTQYFVVSNRLKNVQDQIPDTAIYASPAHANPAGWFLSEGD